MNRKKYMQTTEFEADDTDAPPAAPAPDIKTLLATLAEGLTDEDLARPCDIAERLGEAGL